MWKNNNPDTSIKFPDLNNKTIELEPMKVEYYYVDLLTIFNTIVYFTTRYPYKDRMQLTTKYVNVRHEVIS